MTNVLMDVKSVGGEGGNRHTVSGLEGDRGNVRKLGVWCTDWNIAAIKVWFDNGYSQLLGEIKGDYKELVIGPNDKLVSAMLADNGSRDPANKRLGSIRLVFGGSGEQQFHARMHKDFGTEQSIDVGSGILVGVEAGAGADIDSLGLQLFRPVRQAVIREVKYEDLSYWNDQIRVTSIDTFTDQNNDDTPSNWQFEGGWSKTISSSWSTTTASELTFGARVEAGVPEIVTVEASFEFKTSRSFSHGTTITDEVSHRWVKSGVLEPGDSIHLEAVVGTAQITPRFTGLLELAFDNGATLKRPISGEYAGVAASNVVLKTTDGRLLASDAPTRRAETVV